MKGMFVKLVFAEWLDRDFKSVYYTPKGVDLSTGQFHSGTTFDALVDFGPDEQAEMKAALADGYIPAFHLIHGRGA
jgi:hypothetical protein